MNPRRFYAAVDRVGVNHLARLAFRRRLLVLAYHGISDGDGEPTIADPSGLHTPLNLFERQLEFLLARYQPVSLDDVRRHFLEGLVLPPQSMLITFDDGYRNVARNALPLLDRLGVPSVVFVVTGNTDRGEWLWHSVVAEHCAKHPEHAVVKKTLGGLAADERRRWIRDNVTNRTMGSCDHSLLDWSELREVARMKLVAIGSHCISHEPLATCEPGEAQREVEDSKRMLEDQLKIEIDSLAYPLGSYDSAVLASVRQSGYRLAFTTEPRHAHDADAAVTIPRILVGRSDQPASLAARTAGWQEWVRPVVQTFKARCTSREKHRIVGTWLRRATRSAILKVRT